MSCATKSRLVAPRRSVGCGGPQKLWPLANFRRRPPDDDSMANFATLKPVGPLSTSQLLVTSLALALLMANCFWVRDIVCLAGSLDFANPNAGRPPAATTNGSSELSLDSRGLEAVPVAELCSMMGQQVDQINVVSLANNRIRQIDGGDFQCSPVSSSTTSSSGSGSATRASASSPSVLRILILRNNEIERIAGAAFNGLGSLQVLLLDNNRLTAIPSNETLRPLKALRHLNLANNRIESLDDEAFVSENSNLISLNLNGNPVHKLGPNSLVHLTKLKTLTLSQSALSGQLAVLNGLPELRYYHLDRGENLRVVPGNLCQSSRKLSSLVLKSNNFEQVPQFQQCQSLLLLDLSYNRIQGSLSANFTNQPNLIDLYLRHNQIDTIEENAFAGLTRLQVLELEHNNLKQIHPGAFLAIRSTLYELNLSNNHQLTSLSNLGLDRLASFKAYGNRQLRRLPQFKSASSLVLTYAYHCCDYLATPPAEHSGLGHNQAPEGAEITLDEGPLITQLLSSALNNIRRLLVPMVGKNEPASGGERDAVIKPPPSDNDTSEIGEIILWPKAPTTGTGNNVAATATNDNGNGRQSHNQEQQNQRHLKQSSFHLGDFDIWQTEATTTIIGTENNSNRERARPALEANLSRPEVMAVVGNNLRWQRRQQRQRRRRAARDAFYNVHLIDELLAEAKQIRLDHSVGLVHQIWRRPDAAADGGRLKGTLPDRKTLVSSLDQNGIAAPSAGGRHQNIIEFWSKYVADEADGEGYGDDDDDDDVMRAAEAQEEVPYDDQRVRRHNLLLVGEDQAAKVLGKMLVPINRQQVDSIRHHRDTRQDNKIQQSSPTATPTVQCLPKPSPFFPCQDLFDTWWLRTGVWCVFLLAFTGNILVIVVLSSVRQSSSSSALTNIMWLAHSKRHIDVPRFLVINLAIADLIMALYLGILAFVDLSTLGEFKMFAIKWQYSTGCKLASFLGVLSSELSIFILAIITLERNYAITNAVHLNRRLSLHKAMFIMFIGYAFAFLMAIMPLNGISDYRKFSICLPLDMDSNFYSHIYVMALICINAFSFILLLSCYLRMYCAIRGSQAWNTNDLRIAKRMSILVITDFLCWMPIIVAGIGSLFGHHLIGSNGIKILTIFILPLNSVANPFLYAITTKKFKRDLDTLLHRLRRIVSWILCSSGANTKDPNAFAGYNNNNYHRNMMIMMDKNKRPYGASKSAGNHQRDSNGLAASNRHHQVHRGQDRRHQLTRTVAAQTAEQCTVNRTTYNSCRRLEIQQTTSDGGLVVHQKALIAPSPHLKPPPRITNQASPAPSPGGRHRRAPDDEHYQSHLYADADETVGYHHPLSTGYANAGIGSIGQVLGIPKTLITDDLRPSSEVIICTTGAEDEQSQRDSLIASNSRFLVSSVTSPGHLDSGGGSQHLTSNLNVPPKVGDPQRHLLSVSIQQTNRSASACGFPPNVDTSGSGGGCGCDHPEARAVGSCDTVRAAGNGNSLDKLSRSINRLLFHPIAKAWSSIQISLNSNGGAHLGGVTNATTGGGGGGGGTNVLSEEKSNSGGGGSGGSSRSSSVGANKSTMDSDQLLQDSTTMDDLLMVSGGSQPSSRQLFRNNERRMSRSCDHIKSQSSPTSILLMSPTSSGGGHEATTTCTTITSQGDYDDDERILLATIGRMTANNSTKGRPPIVRLATHDKATLTSGNNHHRQQYARNRCTRCRSWSPALLNKLEDCIYQIKCRIPGLSVRDGCHMDQEGETASEYRNYDLCDTDHQSSSTPEGLAKLNHSSEDAANDDDDDDDDDQFDGEENPLNRGNRAIDGDSSIVNRGNHKRLNRFHQQSSGTSDTLSTRTGGTIVTNMSASFDSNTNIPNQVCQQNKDTDRE